MRRVYKIDDKTGELVELIPRDAPELHFVVEDTRDVFTSPVTGEKFDSLSKYKAHIKESGYEITGGEHFTGKGLGDFNAKDMINGAEMHDAAKCEINKAKYGMMPCTEREKQLWKEEERAQKGESNNLRELQMRGIKEKSKSLGVPMQELMRMKRSF